MKRKIIGITVGTTMNPKRLDDYIGNGKTAYQYAQDGGYTGTEEEFSQKLAEDAYSKEEIDTMFGSYVTDVASLIGGIEE